MLKTLRVLFLFVFIACFIASPNVQAQSGPNGQPAAPGTQPIIPPPSGTPIPPDKAHSTTGPVPPRLARLAYSAYIPTANALTINVPPYTWTHGCGPTAAGMVIGYWDLHGFARLYPQSNSFIQTSDISEGIASSTGVKNHYNDYALPLDNNSPTVQPDCSSTAGCVPHADNSLADFMFTSRSSRGMKYGWSYFNDIGPALKGYVNYINSTQGAAYRVSTVDYNVYSANLWPIFTNEIKAGRPPVFLVDTDGDGSTDHFIAVTGYDIDGSGNPWYRANDTWDTSQEHWFLFQNIGPGRPWGVYGMTTFSIIDTGPTTQKFYLPVVNTPKPPLSLSDVTLLDYPAGSFPTFVNGNNDRLANPGEFQSLRFTLQNPSSTPLSNLNFSLQVSDPYINSLPVYNNVYWMSSDFGSIPGNTTYSNIWMFYFMIARNAPPGHVVNYSINVTDAVGNQWAFPGSFTITGTDTTPPHIYSAGPQGGYYPVGSKVNINALILEAGSVTYAAAKIHPPSGANPVTILLNDNGVNGDMAAGDRIFSADWTPTIQSDYLVDISTQDDLGHSATYLGMIPFSTKVFTQTSAILLVMDEHTADPYTPYYTSALNSDGYPFDLWNSLYRGPLDSAILNGYTSGVVIYAMPDYGYLSGWDSAIPAALVSYLDGGGRLFITGQDVGYYLGNSNNLYKNYLHAQYVQDDIDLYRLDGKPGDPITNGLTVSISGGDGANNQSWPDEMNPISPAVPIFTYNSSGGAPAAVLPPEQSRLFDPGLPGEKSSNFFRGQAAPLGIQSSGTGGLRVQEGTYKIVYLGFGFEAINTAAARALTMSRIITWLQAP